MPKLTEDDTLYVASTQTTFQQSELIVTSPDGEPVPGMTIEMGMMVVPARTATVTQVTPLGGDEYEIKFEPDSVEVVSR